MLRVESGNSIHGFTEFEEDIHFDDDDPDFGDDHHHHIHHHHHHHVPTISVPFIIAVPAKMSLASVHPVELHSSHSSLTTLSHSLDDVSSWSSQVEQVMTIEQLRDQMTSCFTCGVSWADDHVSLDCSECGGYAMRRPCPSCDGTCGSQWKRDLSMSHASSKAKWLGECSTTTTTSNQQQQQQSAKDLEHREEQHQKKEVTTAVAATTTSAAAATATTTTNRIAAQELCNRLEKLSATTNS
ncbi:PREDICTED: protein pinocchio [Nicrophorus vespilloides]|uniref:Protein pinocchio n=1 Tax=Nicrophorus vespilloides TaxID=110193 RepID=A0ABM1NFF2_NICVS|nr:PREDICTED: protein pinocchio [Nicrophorus vespilloides]